MEKINANFELEPKTIRRIEGLIDKKFSCLRPEHFLAFIDFYMDNQNEKTNLVITNLDKIPKDQKYNFGNIEFLKLENYYFGDFIYVCKSTKEKKILNKPGFRTLFLSLDHKQELITQEYKQLIAKLPMFEMIVIGFAKPEDNEFVNEEFYNNYEIALFEPFIFSRLAKGYDKRFSAVILDENKNIVYNREMFFESEEDFELRNFIASDLQNALKEIHISKRISYCRFWYNTNSANLSSVSALDEQNSLVKAALYQISNDFSVKLLEEYTIEKYD